MMPGKRASWFWIKWLCWFDLNLNLNVQIRHVQHFWRHGRRDDMSSKCRLISDITIFDIFINVVSSRTTFHPKMSSDDMLTNNDMCVASAWPHFGQKWRHFEAKMADFSTSSCHFRTKFLDIVSAKNVVGNVMLATCCRKCCVVSSRPKMSSGMSSSTTFVVRRHVVSSRWHSRQQVHHWFKWPLLFSSTWSCTRTSWFDLKPNLNLYLY